MEGCFDCQQGEPSVKDGKVHQQDTSLCECDNPECDHKVCRQHLHSLYTIGDYCAECAEKVKDAVQIRYCV